MKAVLLNTLFAMILLSFGCGEGAPAENADAEAAADTTAMAAPAPAAMSGEGYEIKILEADIPSPRKEMKGTIGTAGITINYGSPSVKEREIGGVLVPYDKVGRTGPTAMTTIEFASDVKIEGQTLPAGKYGLLSIPGKDKWTIIFSKSTDNWGDNGYDEANDALRVMVTPAPAATAAETMDFMVMGDAVVLKWADLTVPFKVGV